MKSKNEFSTHTLANLAKLAKNTLKKANNKPVGEKITFPHRGQAEMAKEISSILSGWYRKITPDEWQHLADNHPGWMGKRNRLENELDGYFLKNDPAAGTKVFYKLIEHLRNAPVITEQREQIK